MRKQTNSIRILAALGAGNDAILRLTSRDELHQRVCDAIVDGRALVAASIFEAEADGRLGYVAGAGTRIEMFGRPEVLADPAATDARDIMTLAFRSGRSCVVNDLQDDERVRVWREMEMLAGIGAAAAVPIARSGSIVGIFLIFFADARPLDDEVVLQMEHLAENVSFASDKLERENEKDRLTRMVSALSATNEAILRAETREKLFELVCDAAVLGGKFTATTIALAEAGSDFLRNVAATGPSAEFSRTVKVAITEAHPEGRGLTGTAFRTRKPCISNDYLADRQRTAFHGIVAVTGARSGAALPLLSRGQAVGVLLFMSAELNTFTPEFVELLQRLAANVSFALENFDRADEKVRAEERIRYLATHDHLTDLPNRTMFNQLLGSSIKTALRYQRQCAVLFIDVDRFKIINDSLGHAAGDALLVEMAGRLRNGVRKRDVVARLGGDEFVVLLDEVAERKQAATAANYLLSEICKPLELNGHECRVTASIGIAMFPSDGMDELALMKNADCAMYLAKQEGKNDIRFFSDKIRTESIDRLTLETSLRHALERNEFCLHYQPKRNVATGEIAGVEALLRWVHPDLGMLPPNRFIPLAEETGLIVPIGRWVMKAACAQNMAWQRDGLPPLSVAVNVSPRQFSDENLLQDVDNALAASGMDPKLLQIEITESMVMLNVDKAVRLLDAIQSRGVRLAIDDFGTGYSSMSVMKRFPIDTIKIDRSFIRELPHNSEDNAIAQAIIGMGKALGLTIVAEGVETVEQDQFLREHACDEIQGFLYSKPVAAGKIADLLRGPSVAAPPLQPEAGLAATGSKVWRASANTDVRAQS
jgi:diguanylate cyclase (GGDEF)-like protein